MTSRERLLRCLRREPTDRCPVRLWEINPLADYADPTWRFLRDLILEYKLDTFLECPLLATEPGFLGPGGPLAPAETWEEPSAHQGYVATHSVLHAPAGDLHSVYLTSTEGRPGYQQEYCLKSVDDCEKWLSIPEADYELAPERYYQTEQAIGERGVAMVGLLPEALWKVQEYMGSEFLALASVEHRDLLHAMLAQSARRLERYVARVLEAGIRGLFGYAGPELCIPPLQSPRDFDDFVTRYDRPILEMIHAAGGLVWVHCHGNMDPVLERFADDLHLDCLNPLEPPPVGISLAEAKRRVGDRMTLEGNLEMSALELGTPEEVRRLTLQALEEGMPGGGFILCHSSFPFSTVRGERIRANYEALVTTAAEHWWY